MSWTPDETAAAMDTFRGTLITNAPSARRAAERLATKGLESRAKTLAKLVVERYAEQPRLAKLLGHGPGPAALREALPAEVAAPPPGEVPEAGPQVCRRRPAEVALHR